MKKKLMIVAPYAYPKIGGLENYVHNISEGLFEKYNWEIVIVTSNHESKDFLVEEKNGIKYYRLPYWFKLSNTPINPLWVVRIASIIKKESPNVINVHSPVPYIADIASLMAGSIPVVVTYHAGSMIKGKGIIDLFIRLYEATFLRLVFKKAKHIVSYSEEFIKSHLKDFEDKIVDISPGIDTGKFKPPSEKRNGNKVLFVGRIEKSSQWKGIMYLLEAIELVHKKGYKVELDIIGPGDAISMYQDQASALGISNLVIFSGGLTGDALIEKYQTADILVLPSVTNAESFGIVLLEAMACGIPVIGSRVGGISQVIQNNVTGLLVEPKNVRELADGIINLLTNFELANTLGKAGRALAINKYRWSIQVEKYNTLLLNLINSPKKIYQVTAYYPPSLGGMQNCVKEISERLSDRGYETSVLTSNIDYQGKRTLKPKKNLSVTYFRSLDFAHTPFSFDYLWNLFFLFKPNILHLHVANAFYVDFASVYAYINKIPYLAHVHIDPDPSGKLGFLLPIYKKFVLRHILRNASRVICLTETHKQIFISQYKLEAEKVVVIPNGVNDSFFRMRKQNKTKLIQLLFVGRLSIQKNIPLLINAVSKMKVPVKLNIVGEGPERLQIEKQVKQLGLKNVNLLGALYGEELITMYQTTDIFFFPTSNEGMSLAMLEAMAAGLPIVTSDISQNRDFIGKGAQYVQDSKPESYAAVLDKLILDEAQMGKMAQYNRVKAKEYSWENVVDRIVEQYKHIW